jgi:hypothetical protein
MADKNRLIREWQVEGGARCVCWSPDGRLLAVGTGDGDGARNGAIDQNFLRRQLDPRPRR